MQHKWEPGKEKHYTKVTSLQAQIQLASSALLYIKLNAGLVNMQLSLTGGLWFAADICLKGTSLNTALYLQIAGTVSIVDSS